MKARTLFKELDYLEFRNFEPMILRASNLIAHGLEKGKISECTYEAHIGSGAIRTVKDYELDVDAEELIRKMALPFKLGRTYPVKNESAIFSLLEKFCILNNIDYKFQFRLDKFIYDFRYQKTLIEFDEPYHQKSSRYKEIDEKKNQVAIENGYEIIRFDLSHDIIDMLQHLVFKQNKYLVHDMVCDHEWECAWNKEGRPCVKCECKKCGEFYR